MASLIVKRRRFRVLYAAYILIGLSVAGTLVFGWLGERHYVHTTDGATFGTSDWDTAYYTLQLFVLGSKPLEEGYGDFGWMLLTARYLGAIAFYTGLVTALAKLLDSSVEALRWRVRHTNHVVVVGTTRAAETIAVAFQHRGHRVEWVDTGDVDSLRAAGIARAQLLFACEPDQANPTANLDIARNAAKERSRRFRGRPLRVVAHVSDPMLALYQAAQTEPLAGTPEPVVTRVMDLDVEAAASHLSAVDLSRASDPLVVVGGLGSYGGAILVELARAWERSETWKASGKALPVIVADPQAKVRLTVLADRWPVVNAFLDIRTVDSHLDVLVPLEIGSGRTPSLVVICHEGDDKTREAALLASRWWNTADSHTLVHLDHMNEADGGSSASAIRRFFAEGPERLLLAGAPDIEQMLAGPGDFLEGLARQVHARFLERAADKDEKMGSRPALAPWEDLGEELRSSNRTQVAFFPNMLGLLRCRVTLRDQSYQPFILRPEEVEYLARHEHTRWTVERAAAGWTEGPRDPARKQNPLLVPWDALPVKARELNQDIVHNLELVFEPYLLQRGLQIVRPAPLEANPQPGSDDEPVPMPPTQRPWPGAAG